jgi:hypothetical protein
MMKTFCLDSQQDRGDGVHRLLFAAMEAFHESLHFFGHALGGPFWKKNGFVKILLLVL